jgi:hypothetical protein
MHFDLYSAYIFKHNLICNDTYCNMDEPLKLMLVRALHGGHMPIIPADQEVKIGWITIQGQLRQKVRETPHLNTQDECSVTYV